MTFSSTGNPPYTAVAVNRGSGRCCMCSSRGDRDTIFRGSSGAFAATADTSHSGGDWSIFNKSSARITAPTKVGRFIMSDLASKEAFVPNEAEAGGDSLVLCRQQFISK